MPTEKAAAGPPGSIGLRFNDRGAARLGIGVAITFLLAMLGNWTLAYLAPVFAAPMLQRPAGPSLRSAAGTLVATIIVAEACFVAANLSQVMPGLFLVLLWPALFFTFRHGLRGGSPIIMLVGLCALLLVPMVANVTDEAARQVARSFVQNIGLSLVVTIAMYAVIPPGPSEPSAKPKQSLTDATATRRALQLMLLTGSYAILYFSFRWSNIHTPLYVAIYAYAMSLTGAVRTASGILIANVVGGVLAMVAYQFTEMTPYLPFIAAMVLALSLGLARLVTSDAPWAPFAGFGLSVLMILYGESIQPFDDSAGSNFTDRFGELFMAALWAIGCLAILETFIPTWKASQGNTKPGDGGEASSAPVPSSGAARHG